MKLNGQNRLPLYFTGAMTVMFLLVGTVLLFQIINLQSNHNEMDRKQDILLKKMDSDLRAAGKTFNLMKATFEQSSNLSAQNVNMTKINAKNIQNILDNITYNLVTFTDRLVKESNQNLEMFDAQNIVVNNMAGNITEINEKLTQLLGR